MKIPANPTPTRWALQHFVASPIQFTMRHVGQRAKFDSGVQLLPDGRRRNLPHNRGSRIASRMIEKLLEVNAVAITSETKKPDVHCSLVTIEITDAGREFYAAVRAKEKALVERELEKLADLGFA